MLKVSIASVISFAIFAMPLRSPSASQAELALPTPSTHQTHVNSSRPGITPEMISAAARIRRGLEATHRSALHLAIRSGTIGRRYGAAGLKVTGKVVGEHGALPVVQNVMTVAIISAFLAAHEQHQMNQLTGKDKPSDFLEAFKNAGTQLANDLPFYLSVAATGSTTAFYQTLIAQPVLQRLATSSGKQFLASTINTSALTALSFLTWELAAQLWQEAIFLESDDASQTLTKNEVQIALNSLKISSLFSAESSETDRRVLSKILSNMGTILALNPELMSNWLYNSYRLRLSKGDMVTTTVLGALGASAGAAGYTAACAAIGFQRGKNVGTVAGTPGGGAGRILGAFIGGLIGAGISILVPESWKNSITIALQDDRIRKATNLREHLAQQLYFLAHYSVNSSERSMFFERILGRQQGNRSNATTVYLERIYDYMSRNMEGETRLAIYEGSQQRLMERMSPETQNNYLTARKKPQYVFELEQAMAPNIEIIDQTITQLYKYYNDEILLLENTMKFYGDKWTGRERNAISREMVELGAVRDYLLTVTAIATERPNTDEIRVVAGAEESDYMASQRDLNFFYMKGFKERDIRLQIREGRQ